MKRKIKDKLLVQLDYVWRGINKHKLEWLPHEIYVQATERYHQQTHFKQHSIRNKLIACIDIVTHDISDTLNVYLPLLTYITIIVSDNINTGKRFVRKILSSNLPFDEDAFKALAYQVYQVNITCINACPQEV